MTRHRMRGYTQQEDIVEVDLEQQPAEGEVMLFTAGGGGFVVKGTFADVARALGDEKWCNFDLAESGDRIMIRSDQVVAVRGATSKHRRGSIGFVHRD